MNKVAKLVIVDNKGKYLLLYRNAHPTFGDDPDVPGGTSEDDETPIETMVREVYEETGIVVDKTKVSRIYEGTDYSMYETHYSLFFLKLNNRPDVVISREHSSYEWLDRNEFLEKAEHARDIFMHMTYNTLQ